MKFKVYNNYIELQFDVPKENELDSFINLLIYFRLDFRTLICTCSYDKELMDISQEGDEINISLKKTKKGFIRTIQLKETKFVVNSVKILKKMFEISNNYDAILTFKSLDDSNVKTNIVINDNGHNYINFDKNEYSIRGLKENLKRIFV